MENLMMDKDQMNACVVEVRWIISPKKIDFNSYCECHISYS